MPTLDEAKETIEVGGRARQGSLFQYASVHPPGPNEGQFKWYKHLPRITMFEWVRDYKKGSKPWKQKAIADLCAGLVLGVMLIPQGLADALLAGVPPIYGLYSSIIPLYIYPLFSTSPQLATGPTAMVSMLSYSAVRPFADADKDPQRFLDITLLITLMSGLIQVALGLLHMGFLVNFLSHPLLTGFLSGASITIIVSQLGYLFGFKVVRSDSSPDMIADIIHKLPTSKWIVCLLALENFVLLIGLTHLRDYLIKHRRFRERPIARTLIKAMPIQLIVVIVNIVLSVTIQLDKVYKVPVVGKIPSGLPSAMNIFERVSAADVGAVIPNSIVVAVLAFVEAISIAKGLMYKFPENPQVESDQELYGIGFGNVFGCWFGCFASSGSLSRTAVNTDVGAQSPAASLITATILLVTVVFLTPLFERLPSVSLAAIIIVAVAKLVEWRPLKQLWKLSKEDFFVYIVAFVITVCFGMPIGIATSCGLAVALVLQKLAFPYWSLLGRVGEGPEFRSLHRDPNAHAIPGISIVRFDARLFFANADTFQETIVRLSRNKHDKPRYLVVDCSMISRIDATGVHTLLMLPSQLAEGTEMVLTNAREILCDIVRVADQHHHGSGKRLILRYLAKPLHSTIEELEEAIMNENAARQLAALNEGDPDAESGRLVELAAFHKPGGDDGSAPDEGGSAAGASAADSSTAAGAGTIAPTALDDIDAELREGPDTADRQRSASAEQDMQAIHDMLDGARHRTGDGGRPYMANLDVNLE